MRRGICVTLRHDTDVTRPDEVFDQIMIVRIHVEHEPAALRLAIIPARALRRIKIAVENPPAGLEPRRQDAAEEPGVLHLAQLVKARKENLVLHRSGLHARGLGGAHDLHRLIGGVRDRLFQIDVLSGRDRAQRALAAPAGRRDIEIDVDRLVGERRAGVRRPLQSTMRGGEGGEFFRIAPEQHRLRNEPIAVASAASRPLADRQHRADQMLVGAEASGDAIHCDAKCSCCHDKSSLSRRDDAVRRGGA